MQSNVHIGLANAINTYLRLKIRVVCRGSANLRFTLNKLVIPDLSLIYFCI